QLADAQRAARLDHRRDCHGDDRDVVHRRRGPGAVVRNRIAVPAVSLVMEATEKAMSKKCYVVHTYSGHENKVKMNLEKAIHSAGLDEQFGQILVATEEFVEMKDGKRKTSKRKTFPSYVMVEMALNDATKFLVPSVPGVTLFI